MVGGSDYFTTDVVVPPTKPHASAIELTKLGVVEEAYQKCTLHPANRPKVVKPLSLKIQPSHAHKIHRIKNIRPQK
jgi:hypothetical protein